MEDVDLEEPTPAGAGGEEPAQPPKSRKRRERIDASGWAKRTRRIDDLLGEVAQVQVACLGEESLAPKERDPFLRMKNELHVQIRSVRQRLEDLEKLKADKDSHLMESKKIEQVVNVEIPRAQEMLDRLDEALNNERGKVINGLADGDLVAEREDLLATYRKEVEYLEWEFKGRNERIAQGDGGRQFNLARKLRKKRMGQSGNNTDPRPPSKEEMDWLQESYERDKELDDKLDLINEGVGVLKGMAVDIGTEIDQQDAIIKRVQGHMDEVHQNVIMEKDRLDELMEMGKTSRWCPYFILIIILAALIGYIYNKA